MLRIMRKYQKGVLGILAILFVCLAMAGFGIDMFLTGAERQAITVNDKTVAYSDYYRELRQTRDRYVQMFGAKFSELAKSFNLNIPQQVVDQMINGLLIEQQAEQIGLAVGDEELKGFLLKSFEGDTARYANYLKVSGMTAPQFEAQTKKDLLREQFSSLLKLASFASKKEARALLAKDETSVDIQYVKITSDSAREAMPNPDDQTLKSYFENNVTDFQNEPLVSYSYLAVPPSAAASDVIISDEDIAFYLSENEKRFSTLERAKIRHIELLFPKGANDAQQKETKDRAEELRKRAQNGEPFESLVMEASDDITTKMLGGELGWVDRKTSEGDLGVKVFALKGVGIADLVSTNSGYRIVKVDEYQPSKVKELSEVRAEIEGILRAQEAPAYTAARTQELLAKWRSGGVALADIAAQLKGSVGKTDAEFGATKDPGNDLQGLTRAVLEQSDQSKQLLEIGQQFVFVEIQKYTEPSVPAFDTIKDRVVAAIKSRDAEKAAQKTAQDLLERIKKGEDFSAVTQSAKLKIEKKEKFNQKSGATGDLADPKLMQTIKDSPKADTALGEVYQGEGGFVLAKVTQVHLPSEDDIKAKLPQYTDQADSSVSNTMISSVLNRLKSSGKVDFDQSILTN